MELPLSDLKSLPGQQIYYLYGFAGLLLLLLLAVFRTIAGPSKQTSAARKIKGTSNVLFVGPMASGKTSLFGRLVYRSPPPTHTSLTSNSAILPGKNIQLIDLPGHPRLRSHLLARYLPSADGVVFFIDPATNATAQGIQTTAEHLHVLLSMLNILESKGAKQIPPVLLLLTKSDTWSAAQKQRAQDRVKTMLERELEKRRKSAKAGASSSARLESIDELPSGSSASPFRLFSWLWKPSSASVHTQSAPGGITLPEDEQEILQTDVLDFDGPFSWDEDKLGIKVSWATSTSKGSSAATESSEKEKTEESTPLDQGVEGFWNWVDEEVL